ncbi:polyprenyl diphosphate synthase [Kamptonema cortianum]|nr:polyprenyl diphosphate synthase [Geitlerinema splendidum]MDK3158835.1 polyprenyl diphosphate synthase [Kamptonema cortianum]
MNAIQRRAAELGIDLSALPEHVAIIMDGNGRFAQKRGLGRLIGHRQGYKTLKNVLLDSANLGIGYLTVYAFSAENWRRPEDEVGGLMKLIEEAAKLELKGLIENNVRVRVIGRLSAVPPSLADALQDLVDSTAKNTGITFTLAINYGGRAELVDAVKQLVNKLDSRDITEEVISQHMYAPDIPDPDLMIRTAGEMRWSNFLIWQSAYTELFVTEVNWPEFGEAQLLQAVAEFQRRTRKFGGLVKSP